MREIEGENFWINDDKQLGIVETDMGDFDIYFRNNGRLGNHNFEWCSSYEEALEYIDENYLFTGDFKKVSREEFLNAIDI